MSYADSHGRRQYEGTQLECEDCGLQDTSEHARGRAHNPGRCRRCDGELMPPAPERPPHPFDRLRSR